MEKDIVQAKDHELLLWSIEDPKVFGAIVDRYQEPFFRKALSITHNEEDAKDLVQEAFVKIYLNASKFEKRAGAAFNSWAYKILLNTCFSHYKKHKKEKGNVTLDESFLNVEEPIEEESLKERFALALSRIPEKSAKLLRLLVLDGRSQKDVSRLLDIKEAVVRVRLHRAKESFQKMLIENPNL